MHDTLCMSVHLSSDSSNGDVSIYN